jgi:hypothetical protein
VGARRAGSTAAADALAVDANVLVYAHRREAAEHRRSETLLTRDRHVSLFGGLHTRDPFA